MIHLISAGAFHWRPAADAETPVTKGLTQLLAIHSLHARNANDAEESETDFHADDAPDLSTPEWSGRFAKTLLASRPLDGIDLERTEFGREVQLTDVGAPLQTEEEYRTALREIEQYFREEPGSGTPEAARFDQLAQQIRLYESTNLQISPPTPEE